MAHLTASVRHSSKVKRYLLEAEATSFEALPIPKGFHDQDRATIVERSLRSFQNGSDPSFREAIQEFAHPNDVRPLRKKSFFFQKVDRMERNPIFNPFFLYVLFSRIQLPWKVEKCDMDRRGS